MHEITVKTEKKIHVIDITHHVKSNLHITNGIVNIFTQHTTAAITINEYEPGLINDLEHLYTSHIPDRMYEHDRVDNNARSHLMASILKPSITVPVQNRTLMLGTWQKILFVELDGPRTRRVLITEVEV